MKRLPNVNLTIDEFSYIYEMNRYSFGGEAIILQSNAGNSLYKIFTDRNDKYVKGMSDNKFEKIKKLYQLSLPNTVKPISSITIDKHLVGYEMTYDKNDIILTDAFLSKKEMINILNETKNILETFRSNNIIYGDIKGNNILINPKTHSVKYCDMDNIYIDGLNIDLYGRVLKKFIKEFGTLDFNASIYMHNLFTLLSLKYPNEYSTYDGVISRIKDNAYPDFIEDKAKDILEGIANPKRFNGKYLVKYLKR